MTKHAFKSDGSVVLYDKILTNIRSGYDATTGTFTAPVEGTYVFHFYALASLNSIIWIELFHNNQYVVSSYGYTNGSYASSGNTVVLRLHIADTVKIKTRRGTDVKLYGASGQYYASFCGALLSPSLHEEGSNTQHEIAFSVGLSHSESAADSPNVVFNRVFVNLGQNFNVNTGIFTATVPGIYAFHYHATAQKGKSIWMELYRNYIYVNSLYGSIIGDVGPGGNSAVLELVAGDTVYLDIQHHGSFLYGERDRIYATFSGYLLSTIAVSHPIIG
ncbi:complement C1q tumor necrosis factor-related protein 4-like [Saccostrea cucullata]|uniref:complement C1q tumor necrosis factor-related protein 4-like n=1 Tax=Saccostrea cuccullata TaxID=36930 RepID=UPI002ED6BD7E